VTCILLATERVPDPGWHPGALWLALIFPAILIGIPLFARLNVGRERKQLRAWAAPYLEPGERLQAVFKVALQLGFDMAQHLDPYLVAATDRRILVLHVEWRRVAEPRRLPMQLDREQRFGVPYRRGAIALHPSILLGGETVVVPKRFFPDVAAADAALDDPAP
jgi:hypothetical protein